MSSFHVTFVLDSSNIGDVQLNPIAIQGPRRFEQFGSQDFLLSGTIDHLLNILIEQLDHRLP